MSWPASRPFSASLGTEKSYSVSAYIMGFRVTCLHKKVEKNSTCCADLRSVVMLLACRFPIDDWPEKAKFQCFNEVESR